MTSSAPVEQPEVTVVPWAEFAAMFEQTHRPGEHISIVGPTGSGKTVLALCLCRIIGSRPGKDGRPYRVTVFATKPRDRTVSALGWPVAKEWPTPYGEEHSIVWPRPSDPETRAALQRRVFLPIMQDMFAKGDQAVCIDEAAYFETPLPSGLGLRTIMSQFWQEGRGLDLTLIAGTQRPRRVTRSMWSEPAWVFVFRVDDKDDLRRVGEVAGRDDLAEVVDYLGGHEFAVVHRPRAGERMLYVSRVEAT